MDSTYDEVSGNGGMVEETKSEPVKSKAIDVHAYAGFWIRFWAFLLDGIVVWSVNHLTVSPFFSLFGWSKAGGWFSPYSVTTAIVFLLYFAIMTKIFSQTLGKMVFGIKVISLHPEKKLTGDVIFFREIVGRYINFVGVLYPIVGFSPKKQGVHDYFADTVVVHENLYEKKESDQ
ncbi:RDD family protein [Bacillus sp. NPDC077027]|uniref:RDD family protein n=1 Tax=Bacillus sp. NPDC077027 TaxID=3390548 RepID=UPI003CFBE59A